jgi:hypothetical protein
VRLHALHIRRLTVILLAGPTNHFVLHLPTIQQALVEALRSQGLAADVASELYLCLRVLVCRMGASVLGNLWPVILTELVRPIDPSSLSSYALAWLKLTSLLHFSYASLSRRSRHRRQTTLSSSLSSSPPSGSSISCSSSNSRTSRCQSLSLLSSRLARADEGLVT